MPDLPVRAHLADQPVNSIAAEGDYLFVGTDSAVEVLSIADPAVPTQVGQSGALAGPVHSIVADGDHVFVLAGGQLEVLDVSTIDTPVSVASLDLDGVGLIKQEQRLYAVGNGALSVVDVSDPGHPEIIGRATVPQSASSVALAVGTAYLAGESPQLTLVDVSDPTKTTTIGSAPYPANAVVVQDSTAYVTWQIGSIRYGGPKGLTILDVSDPRMPTAVGYLASTRGVGSSGVMLATPYAIVTEEYGVLAVDVSDPMHPQEVAFHTVPDCFGSTCYLWLAKPGAVRGDLVYVAAGPGGLWVLQLPAAAVTATACMRPRGNHTALSGV